MQHSALQEWDASAPEASGLLLPLAQAPLCATILRSQNCMYKGVRKAIVIPTQLSANWDTDKLNDLPKRNL